jgi:hypothetical protein
VDIHHQEPSIAADLVRNHGIGYYHSSSHFPITIPMHILLPTPLLLSMSMRFIVYIEIPNILALMNCPKRFFGFWGNLQAPPSFIGKTMVSC